MNEAQKILAKMFPYLKGGEVIESTSRPSFNDGGTDYWYIWKVGDQYFRTYHNNWSVKHPGTTCEEVVKFTKTVTEWRRPDVD